jgi:hypothetical protein
MTGEELAFLAGTADLARLEFASPRLTLWTEEGKLYAQYAGAYSSGCRWVNIDKAVSALDIDVDSAQFKHLAGTFPRDAQVRISRTPTSLVLRSDRNNHQLRSFPSQGRQPIPGMGNSSEESVELATCDALKLLTEVDLGADLDAHNSQGVSGLNLAFNKAKHYLRLMSYNGFSALFIAQIDCDDVATDQSMVVPSQDFAKGLHLLSAGLVQLSLNAGRLILRSERGWFSCPTENREWPNFSAMLKKNESQTVLFQTDQVKSATKSASILGAAMDIEVTGTEHGVVLKTAASEAGQFATAVEGSLDGSFWFAAEDLAFAAKMSDEELHIEISSKAPAVVRTERRMLVLKSKAI